jgi:uncharacterized protein (TIGR01777 family)
MKVLVSGGTGFIGSSVVSRLKARKDSVRVITRDPVRAAAVLGQDADTVAMDAEPKALFGGAEAVVNLLGEPIFGKRWTEGQKARIRSSRVDGTRRLVAAMKALDQAARPKVFVSGSAIGYYGPRGDQELNEDAPPGNDFLAEVCREWEAAALEAAPLGVRVVLLRTGVVLGPGGGALAQMMPIFRLGLGGPIGSGSQYLSWIHVEDHVGLVLHAVATPALSGPVNATAPSPRTNKEFAKVLGKVLRRPAFLTTPTFALKLAFGESSSILASGQRVVPKRALESGFRFAHPDLEAALRDLVAKWY